MNIFRKYTRKSLAANRSRTLVTIIGIVLSMALLTAVIEGAYSGIQFMIRSEVEYAGKWEIYLNDISAEQRDKFLARKEIEDSTTWQDVGWAKVDSLNEYKPYIRIKSVPDDFEELVKVRISAGRMPENETELIIPEHIASNGGVKFSVGDRIKLSVGRRVGQSNGRELGQEGLKVDDAIVDTTEKTYTIVGIYERFHYNIEGYSSPAYFCMTKGEASGNYGTFATVKNVRAISQLQDAISAHPDSSEFITDRCSLHTDLVHYNGIVSNEGIQTVIYGFAAVLVVLIAFGSISLIYNSFSISVSERTRQFGILRSIGATKKQLKQSVLYEALVLGAIGIPVGLIVGCAGIGITLYALRDNFRMFSRGTGTQMRLVIGAAALLIAAAVCLIVILISAWIPAARAVRIQPIDAIRQSRDTKIKARSVKTSKLTTKLFGFEGMMASKNFKRNRKRYRATVLSLFMSMVLFISASSFCSYLTDSVEGIVSNGAENIDIYYNRTGEDMFEPEELLKKLSGISGIKSHAYANIGSPLLKVDEELLTDQYIKYFGDMYSNEEVPYTAFNTQLAFTEDAEFRKILKENGLNEEDYFNPASPKAVLYNHYSGEIYKQGGTSWAKFDCLDTSKLPATAEIITIREMEGYQRFANTAEDGKVEILYYPDSYVEKCNNSQIYSYKDFDRSKAIVKSFDEAAIKTPISIVAEVQTTSLLLSSNAPAVIYPYSMQSKVIPSEEVLRSAIYQSDMAFKADDYNRVFDEVKKVIAENGGNLGRLQNIAENRNSERMIVTIVNVFSYGFIILISLIALANVFNTISTSIMLRRREFAMLKSIGLSERGFGKMMNFECIIYGIRSLIFGLPVAVLVTFLIWKITANAMEMDFYLPWKGVVIAVASVFIVVFATMIYATSRIRKDNPIDALKNENI